LATIVTVDNLPVSFGVNHNHPSDHTGLVAASFVTNVKKRCCEEVNPIPSIYDEEIGSLRNRDFDKGNNKITELRTILERESQNS
jgi:hypothetical protein